MNKGTIKMLSLPNCIPRMVNKEGHNWGVETPVVGRDGWYYDRHAKKAWYEYQDRAYVEGRVDDFLYHLNVVLSTHSFTESELSALVLLRKHRLLHHDEPLYRDFRAYVERRFIESIRGGRSTRRWQSLQYI